MPVVWCTDPNSTNKKPTAFTLQGIQLQGNISEQHVLAVRELINAASEGRLLLPTDGAIVLLDCGIGVGSVIIQDGSQSEENKENSPVVLNLPDTNNANGIEDKEEETIKSECVDGSDDKEEEEIDEVDGDIETKPTESNNSDILYEFLCCARCMNGGVSRCSNRTFNNRKIMAKYLDVKMKARLSSDPVYNICNRMNRRGAGRGAGIRRKQTVSFKSEKSQKYLRKIIQPAASNLAANNQQKIPLYATVNKQTKRKVLAKIEEQQKENDTTIATASRNDELNASCRKTSFDSTCTVSSLDSGFIEMQNKKSLQQEQAQQSSTEEPVEIRVNSEENSDGDILDKNVQNSWTRLTIPQQSKNRRKSYEEFKSLFCDHHTRQVINMTDKLDVKSSIKSRRKSYEEFKSVTKILCDNSTTEHNSSNSSNLSNNNLVIKNDINNDSSTSTGEETGLNFLFRIKRKNSKRVSSKKSKFVNKNLNQNLEQQQHQETPTNSTIYDILRKKSSTNLTEANNNSSSKNYEKNLELFKSHCKQTANDLNNKEETLKSNCKIYDKSLAYGTIYDIVQRKTDIYGKTFNGKKYDKYMTYGTLYEILHRKSDDYESFDRKRAHSDKFKRVNYVEIASRKNKSHENLDSTSVNSSKTENLNNNDNKKGNSDINNLNLNSNGSSINSNTSNCSMKLNTIYDIVQGSNGSANSQVTPTPLNKKSLSTIYDILQTQKPIPNITVTDAESSATTTVVSAKGQSKNRFLVRKITEEDLINSNETEPLPTPKNDKIVKSLSDSEDKKPSSDELQSKKPLRMRRFSNILSYTPKLLTTDHNSDKIPIKTNNLIAIENSNNIINNKLTPNNILEAKIDELYSRLNRINNNVKSGNNVNKSICDSKNEKENNDCVLQKSSSMDMLASLSSEHDTLSPLGNHNQKFRKISVPAPTSNHLVKKSSAVQKPNTRRLSEFTRGEFLNEKS